MKQSIRGNIFETNSSSSHAYYYNYYYQTQTGWTGNTAQKLVTKPIDGNINFYNRRHVRIWKKIADQSLPILVTNSSTSTINVEVGKIFIIELSNLPTTTTISTNTIDPTQSTSSDAESLGYNSSDFKSNYYYQWQYSTDSVIWYDIIGAVDPKYAVSYNPANSSLNTIYHFRCVIYSLSDVSQAVVSSITSIKFVLS